MRWGRFGLPRRLLSNPSGKADTGFSAGRPCQRRVERGASGTTDHQRHRHHHRQQHKAEFKTVVAHEQAVADMHAENRHQHGEGQYRAGKFSDAATRYQRAWNAARNYGLREVALSSTEKLQDIALKQNDYREALKWNRETVNYLKDSGGGARSGGDAVRRLENQLAAAEADNRNLREQIA